MLVRRSDRGELKVAARDNEFSTVVAAFRQIDLEPDYAEPIGKTGWVRMSYRIPEDEGIAVAFESIASSLRDGGKGEVSLLLAALERESFPGNGA